MESPVTPQHQDVQAGADGAPRKDDLQGLRRLRDRVEAAIAEIERLRRENVMLAARVAELEAEGPRADDTAGAPTVAMDDQLREKLDGYIAAIDEALRFADAARN